MLVLETCNIGFCSNNGTCIDSRAGAYCLCRTGFTG